LIPVSLTGQLQLEYHKQWLDYRIREEGLGSEKSSLERYQLVIPVFRVVEDDGEEGDEAGDDSKSTALFSRGRSMCGSESHH